MAIPVIHSCHSHTKNVLLQNSNSRTLLSRSKLFHPNSLFTNLNTPKKSSQFKFLIKASDVRIAKLTAEEKKTVSVSSFNENNWSPSSMQKFLNHSIGRKAMISGNAVVKMEKIEDDCFRCYLININSFNFKVQPIIDLKLKVFENYCLVELLDCKFEGSQVLSKQNQRFKAYFSNNFSWSSNENGVQLSSLLTMNLDLEVFTLPFTLLPLSAVEIPGSKMLQTLLEKTISFFLENIEKDFWSWANENSNEYLSSLEDENDNDNDNDNGYGYGYEGEEEKVMESISIQVMNPSL